MSQYFCPRLYLPTPTYAYLHVLTVGVSIFPLVPVQEDELQVIDAIYNRKDGVKLGFVDFYLASYHSDIMHKKKLDIVRIIPRQHAYGVLLGKDWSPEVVDCLRRHSGDNHHVIHKLIPKYIVGSEVSTKLLDHSG